MIVSGIRVCIRASACPLARPPMLSAIPVGQFKEGVSLTPAVAWRRGCRPWRLYGYAAYRPVPEADDGSCGWPGRH